MNKKDTQAKNMAGKSSQKDMHLIVLGASAGGIVALEQFFKHLHRKANMVFVLITHLQPHQKSVLPEIINRIVDLEVTEVQENTQLKPNHIFIIPPGKFMALDNDHFTLSERSHDGPPHPINFFLESIAKKRAKNTIATILSGTGTDGSKGIKKIKEAGGIVIAQDPDSAQFRDMPENAIKTGFVDHVLLTAEIPDFIINYIDGDHPLVTTLDQRIDIDGEKVLTKILTVLKNKTGHDFSSYKRNTIIRRLERRINVNRIDGLNEYYNYIRENPEETANLFKELLIGVTSFFRDPESFDSLRNRVLPDLISENRNKEIRIWVPGAASGEEAYSLAILLEDFKYQSDINFKTQIFATDINASAVDRARHGLYPRYIADDMEKETLKHYFEAEGDQYRIKRDIRESVIFAEHNLIKNPPFTRMNLISCRNLLIYLNADLQNKLLPLFHYSLLSGGYLFLGNSESVGKYNDLFDSIDNRWKIFRKKEKVYNGPGVEFPLESPLEEIADVDNRNVKKDKESTLPRIADKILLDEFSPPSVIIDKKGKILHVHGRTGSFLELAPGKADYNIYEMARTGLKNHLPASIRKATYDGGQVVRENLQINTNGEISIIDLIIRPIEKKKSDQDLLMVIFKEKEKRSTEQSEQERPDGEKEEDNRNLEKELSDTKEDLQTTIEQLEASNEELKSMNEEYQSANEELKSANEELETSREELHSLNEELNTVNHELQNKIEAISEAHKETQSFLNSLDVPTVFLDNEMRVKRFTSQVTDIIHLIRTDIGRPLGDITSEIPNEELLADATRVRDTMRADEKDVRTKSGDWYLRRIIPYRTAQDRIDGVVISFIDINKIKNSEHRLDVAIEELENIRLIIRSLPEGIILLNEDFEIDLVNRSFYQMFHKQPEELKGKEIGEILDGKLVDIKLKKELDRIFTEDSMIENYEIEKEFPEVGRIKLDLTIRKLQFREQDEDYILIIARNISDGRD